MSLILFLLLGAFGLGYFYGRFPWTIVFGFILFIVVPVFDSDSLFYNDSISKLDIQGIIVIIIGLLYVAYGSYLGNDHKKLKEAS